ncbi:MAG: twin-arginine translocase TatA/TatE family subunit [Acidobacteria bacterium]|nr:twin-arginine translocase TatA/TatE family subunit [Acidobacteriota bacterium]
MKLGDILVIGLIVLLLWGPTRLGGLGKGIGEGIRNFRKGLRGSGGVPQDDAVDRREGPKS